MVVYRCDPFNSVARRLRLLVTPRCTMALPTLKWYLYVSLLEDIVTQYTEKESKPHYFRHCEPFGKRRGSLLIFEKRFSWLSPGPQKQILPSPHRLPLRPPKLCEGGKRTMRMALSIIFFEVWLYLFPLNKQH